MQPARNVVWVLLLMAVVAGILTAAISFFSTMSVYFSSAPEINGSILALLVLSLFFSLFGLMKETLWAGIIQQSLSKTPSPKPYLPFEAKWRQTPIFLNHELQQLADAFSRGEVVTSEQLDFVLGYGFGRNLTQLRYLPQAMVTLGLIGTFTGLSLTMVSLSEMLTDLSAAAGSDAGEAMSQLLVQLPGSIDGMGVAFHTSLYGIGCSLFAGIFLLIYQKANEAFAVSIRKLGQDAGLIADSSADALQEGLISASRDVRRASDSLSENIMRSLEYLEGLEQRHGEASQALINGQQALLAATNQNASSLEQRLDGVLSAIEPNAAGIARQVKETGDAVVLGVTSGFQNIVETTDFRVSASLEAQVDLLKTVVSASDELRQLVDKQLKQQAQQYLLAVEMHEGWQAHAEAKETRQLERTAAYETFEVRVQSHLASMDLDLSALRETAQNDSHALNAHRQDASEHLARLDAELDIIKSLQRTQGLSNHTHIQGLQELLSELVDITEAQQKQEAGVQARLMSNVIGGQSLMIGTLENLTAGLEKMRKDLEARAKELPSKAAKNSRSIYRPLAWLKSTFQRFARRSSDSSKGEK